jgi:hypothetical protein
MLDESYGLEVFSLLGFDSCRSSGQTEPVKILPEVDRAAKNLARLSAKGFFKETGRQRWNDVIHDQHAYATCLSRFGRLLWRRMVVLDIRHDLLEFNPTGLFETALEQLQ